MKISKCKTNGVKNPIGFAMEHVTVSWIAESEQSSEQTKAKIVVATDNGMKNIIYSISKLTQKNRTVPNSVGHCLV